MPGLLVIAHAPLASSLKAVAQHVYPDCASTLEALDVVPNSTPEEILVQARALLARVRNPQALIFTDVVGATPCNLAQALADDESVRVVCGVNVPMLWRSLCYANEPLDALVARAVAGGTQGVMALPAAPRPPGPTA